MKKCKECKMEYDWLKYDVCSQCRIKKKETHFCGGELVWMKVCKECQYASSGTDAEDLK